MRSTSTQSTWPSSAPIRLSYLEEQAWLGAWARPGTVVAQRYELEVPLGVHAPGTLWHARQDRAGCAAQNRAGCATQTLVTLQLLDPAIAEDPGMLDAFFHEARIAAAIDHAHVTRVLDYGVDQGLDAGIPFLVLERLVGETLEARLASQPRLSAFEFAQTFRDAARGLEALHGWGLVHRCLDPAHVFLASDGAVPVTKLLFAIDEVFGDHLRLVRKLSHQFAEPAGRASSWDAMDRRTGLDTSEYQSPEQLLGHGTVDERSDLWSLAVIAFEALTGTPAFSGSSLGDRLVQICSGEPNALPADLALPAGFAAWFQKGVRKLPRERFTSARHMADALTNVFSP
jgi:eukaryotic-like serine/threonine-protein kinase